MKVLFIGSERSEARAIATALRRIDRAVTVSWAAHHQHAVKWLDENRDLGVLLVDAQIDGGTWTSLVAHARSLSLHPAVVVITPDGPPDSIPNDADGCIRRDQSLLRELPVVVTRALERAARAELERKLEEAERLLAEQQAKYDIGMARADATWDMVDEQLREAALQVERARQSEEAAAADVERLTRRESELYAQLATAAADKGTLERRLADAQSSVEAANVRTDEERAEAARRLSEQQHLFEAQLGEAMHARQDAEQRHASAANEVARLSEREAELTTLLADVSASRTELEGKLAATEAAFEDAVTRATRERLAASKKAAEREAELDGQIRRERATRDGLEQALADANAALDLALRDQQSAASDVERLEQREAELRSQIENLEATRETLEHTIAGAEEALRDARRDHQSAAADVERLTHREADLAAQLADVQGMRHTLERQLADATSALRSAAAREAELVEQIQQDSARRATLEKTITETDAALNHARREHRSAAADVERLQGREANLVSEVADLQAARDTFEGQLADATSALRSAAAREADLVEQIQQESALRASLETRMTETDAALNDTRRDYRSAAADVERLKGREADLEERLEDTKTALDRLGQNYDAATADVDRLEQREADLTSRLAHIEAIRDTLEQQLAATTGALQDAAAREAKLREAIAAAATELTDERARFDGELRQIATERDSLADRLSEASRALQAIAAREGELAHQLADTQATRLSLEQQLHDATVAIREAATRQAELDEQLELERAGRAELEEDLANAQATRSTLEQTLSDLRARFVEQRQQLEIQLAQEQLEHESRSADMEERNRALTLERNTLQQSLTSLQDQARQLQSSLTARTEAFEVSRAESQRLFDQAGVAMFRCTRDGVLTDANRACATLVGRRTLDELAGMDIAAALFEAPQALSWLIERCVSTRTRESIETTWRRQDGSRLFMRLSARSLPSGVIEVVAEDLTRLRVLEERLGQAQRMEAVGRLASEVAITCSNLLDNIQQHGREWLMTAARDEDARQRGEELLDDIGRAAGFLQELAACRDEQARTPMLVDLNTIVRDLEPVLKSVAGSDVEVQLSETSTPLHVDVGTERIERLLVNLASYGRGRMAPGGRLRIDLGTSIVDRHFSAKHRNVRLGLHALITVTETRRAGRDAERSKSHKASVDFATLQGLVSECGGHLWMNVQPAGEMVAKIRLPLLTPTETKAPRVLVARHGRGRTSGRWFQS